MKTLALFTTLVLSALMLTSAAPEPACSAVYCPPTPCYGSAVCIGSCVCLRSGSGPGTCVSID